MPFITGEGNEEEGTAEAMAGLLDISQAAFLALPAAEECRGPEKMPFADITYGKETAKETERLECCGLGMADLPELFRHYEEFHNVAQSHVTFSPSNPDLMDEEPIVEGGGRRERTLASDPHALSTLQAMLPPMVQNLGEEQFDIINSVLTATLKPSDPVSLRNDLLKGMRKREERPYRCGEKDCGKSYKNANGLKYHLAHGHPAPKPISVEATQKKEERPYRCPIAACGKRYKNANGLKYHLAHGHQPEGSQEGVMDLVETAVMDNLDRIEAALKRERALREKASGDK